MTLHYSTVRVVIYKLYFLVQHLTFLSGTTSQTSMSMTYIILYINETSSYVYVYLFCYQTTVKPGDLTYCLSRTEEVLPIALARPYVEQYVPKQTKVSRILLYIFFSDNRIMQINFLLTGNGVNDS